MGKLVDREIQSLKDMADYSQRQVQTAITVEKVLGALVDDERIRVQFWGLTSVAVLVDGEEDEFFDQLRVTIQPGFWKRKFDSHYGQFGFVMNAHGYDWTVTPTKGARGCTITPVKTTVEITRYESKCNDEQQAVPA